MMVAVPEIVALIEEVSVVVVFEVEAVSVSPSLNVILMLIAPLLALPVTVIVDVVPNTDVGLIVPGPVSVKLLSVPLPVPANIYWNGVVVCAPAIAVKAINAAKHITDFMFFPPLSW